MSEKNVEEIKNNFYSTFYPLVVKSGNQGKFHFFTHRLLEKSFTPEIIFERVLEIGAGNGEHIKFVRHSYSEYIMTDIREIKFSEKNISVTTLKCDIENLPFSDESIDRVVITCLLHHLERPLEALNEVKRVLKPSGVLSILLPSDPGFFYRLTRKITGELKLRRLGFKEGKILHAIDHRNHIQSLMIILEFVFEQDEIKTISWPFKIKSFWNFNLIYVYQIRKIKE